MNQTSSFWNHILYLIINLRLATETSLAVLSTLLLDWLEHLKVPLIDKVFLHIIHIFHVSNDTYITLFGPPQFPSKKQGFPTQLYSCNYKYRYWHINIAECAVFLNNIFRIVWSTSWYSVRILRRLSSDSTLTRLTKLRDKQIWQMCFYQSNEIVINTSIIFLKGLHHRIPCTPGGETSAFTPWKGSNSPWELVTAECDISVLTNTKCFVIQHKRISCKKRHQPIYQLCKIQNTNSWSIK